MLLVIWALKQKDISVKHTTKRLQHFKRGDAISDTELGRIINDWLTSKSLEVSVTTMRGYRSKAKLIDKHFKTKGLTALKPRFVREFLEKLIRRGYSNKSVNEYLIVLRGVCGRLLEDEVIEQDPTRKFKNYRTASSEPDPFTQAEMLKIFSVHDATDSEMALVKFGLFTGLRISELLALAWEDVDLEAGTLHVRRARVAGKLKTPKNRASNRVLDLGEDAVEVLKSIKPVSAGQRMKRTYYVNLEDNRSEAKQRLRIVFLNSRTGGPIRNDGHFSRYFLKPLLKKAGVRYRSPNNCRHTFASQMLTKGVPAAWIASYLGHSSEQMLYKHYAKIIPEDLKNLVEQMNHVFAFVA
jgi:integrase